MVKVAIAGCGAIGQRHAQMYRQIKDVDIVGCFDSVELLAEQLASNCQTRAYRDFDELLNQDVDGLSVCTPPNSHIQFTSEALHRGVRVLCEKPLARTTDECHTLSSTGRLACAFKFRHLSGSAVLRDAIAEGELGSIVAVRGTAASNIDMSGRWFSDSSISGGGVLIDNGVHLIDLCRYLLGPVHSVSACATSSSRGFPVEESAVVHLRMANNAMVQLFVSWEAPSQMPPLLEIFGTRGYARIGYETEIYDEQGKDRVKYVTGEGTNIWWEVINNFVEFVSCHGKPSARFEDGFSALAVVEAAYRSVHSARWEEPVGLAELAK